MASLQALDCNSNESDISAPAPDSWPGRLVFNRTVTLKDIPKMKKGKGTDTALAGSANSTQASHRPTQSTGSPAFVRLEH